MRAWAVAWMLVLSVAGGRAEAPALRMEVIEAERAKLLEGVVSLPKCGVPGPVAIWGGLAFPVVAAPDGRDGSEVALVAAAGYGRGRVVLFGHNAYLDGEAGSDLPKLLENGVRWAGKAVRARVGVYAVRGGEAFYEGLGFAARNLPGPLEAAALRGVDVLVLNAQGVDDAGEAAVVMRWVEQGGGLLAGMTGWAYGQTSGGKELALAHGLHRALLAAGIGFTGESAFGDRSGFDARAKLPALLNARDAVAAMREQRGGRSNLAAEEVRQGTRAIEIALGAQPPDRPELRLAVAEALGGSKTAAVPSVKEPLTQEGHATARLQLSMETRLLRLSGAADVEAHPAARQFPGQPAASAPRVTREVLIQPGLPGWQSTGLYAVAGEPLTVTVPAKEKERKLVLRAGCHTDTLYHLEKWSRAPEITKTAPLTAGTTRFATAFGGLIYVEVTKPEGAGQPFPVQIAGAVEAPLFVLGETSDEEWNREIKKRPAPWAEFACGLLILSAPSEAARKVNNPAELMRMWEKVVAAQDEICNQAKERRRPERIVTDVQISAGYMHSGYPVMVPVSAAGEMLTFNRVMYPGWGFHHELGHNHQRPWFTFEGCVEVTNNVIGMYVYEAVLGKDWLSGHPQISESARRKHVETIKAAANRWETWKADPFVALTTYIQLVQAFGWESWRRYLNSFGEGATRPQPKTSEEARDEFLIRYSQIVNRNLGPFFDAWGIPVSSRAKAEVARLEAWMPADM